MQEFVQTLITDDDVKVGTTRENTRDVLKDFVGTCAHFFLSSEKRSGMPDRNVQVTSLSYFFRISNAPFFISYNFESLADRYQRTFKIRRRSDRADADNTSECD